MSFSVKSQVSSILNTKNIIMKINKIMNRSVFILTIFSLFLLQMITGYPIEKSGSISDLKDETRYPNGTVIGKYIYSDNDGNPVHVKYYADNGSYGVELQSIKIMESSTLDPMAPFPKTSYDILKPIESPFGSELGNYELGKSFYRNKYKSNNNINRNKAKKNKKFAKSSLEYEVFYQNSLQGPSHCGTDKVKVYLDKQNRMTRNTLDDYQATKYCDQF